VSSAPHRFLLEQALRSAGLRDDDVEIHSLTSATDLRAKDIYLTLGNDAFNIVHAGHDLPPVREARGYLWDTPWGARVIPTISLSDIEAEWVPWRILLDLDVKKAAAEAAAGCPALPTYDVEVVTSPRDVQELFERIRLKQRQEVSGVGRGGSFSQGAHNVRGISSEPAQEAGITGGSSAPKKRSFQRTLSTRGSKRSTTNVGDDQQTGDQSSVRRGGALAAPKPLVALDIENHEDMTLACLGCAISDSVAWVIPTPAPLSGWQRSAVAALCALNVPKAFQNGGYDRYFLRKFCGIEVRNHAFDTMLAWHALQPELAGKTMKPRGRRTTAKSLRFLASIYTRTPFYKDYNFATPEERYELCGKDCCVTLEVAAKMAEELELRGDDLSS
jgi:hypothetical protein